MNNCIHQFNDSDIHMSLDDNDILHIKIATHEFNDPVELNEHELEDLLSKLSEVLKLIRRN
jgi:hypothetical protein